MSLEVVRGAAGPYCMASGAVSREGAGASRRLAALYEGALAWGRWGRERCHEARVDGIHRQEAARRESCNPSQPFGEWLGSDCSGRPHLPPHPPSPPFLLTISAMRGWHTATAQMSTRGQGALRVQSSGPITMSCNPGGCAQTVLASGDGRIWPVPSQAGL